MQFATTPWSKPQSGLRSQGPPPSPEPRLPLARKAARRTSSCGASPASGLLVCEEQRHEGRAVLLLMWQSFPAEGRQNAHDSFFQEMLQTIETMPLVGLNVKRPGGGAAMLGTLCVGCQGRALPKQNLLEPVPGIVCEERGKKGGMAAWHLLSVWHPGCSWWVPPRLQPKRGLVLMLSVRKSRNDHKWSHPHAGLEQEQAENAGNTALRSPPAPASPLYTSFPCSDAALRGQF